MPTDKEVLEEGMLLKFCETHNCSMDDLTERAKQLILDRLAIMRQARERFSYVMQRDVGAPEPPGHMEYLTFMLDSLCPPHTEKRLELDLEFAKLNLAIADDAIQAMQEALKPKLVIPGVGETARINGEKGE